DPVKAAAGQRIFQSYCFSCHGADAQGVSNMPRLAGQPAQYVETALKRFRQMAPAASTSPMVGVARGLKDEDIAAVAAYLQGRGQPLQRNDQARPWACSASGLASTRTNTESPIAVKG